MTKYGLPYFSMKTYVRSLAILLAVLGIDRSAHAGLIGLNSLASSSVSSQLFTVNTLTGAATPLLTLTGTADTASFTDIALLNGTLYASDMLANGDFNLASINSTTGATTVLDDQGSNIDWHGLAASPTAGLLYAVDQANGTLSSYDPVTDTRTLIGSTGLTTYGIDDLTFDPLNGILYGISQRGTLYSINTSTAAVTSLGTTGLTGQLDFRLYGLALDPFTQTFFASVSDLMESPTSLYSFTLASVGTPTLLGLTGVNGMDGLEFVAEAAAPVPEPSTVALVGLGLLGAATVRCRRRG